MVIANQGHPLASRLFVTLSFVGPPIEYIGAGFRSTERIRTRIAWILEYRKNGMLERLCPLYLLSRSVPYRRKCYLFFPKPQKDLTSTTEFLEFTKDQPYRVLDPQIRIEFDLFSPAESDRKSDAEIASLGFLPDGAQ
jgi:hypothetical protein